jgi:N-acetylneuraminic acid mutarotase
MASTRPASTAISSWTQLRAETAQEQADSAASTNPATWEHVSEGPWSRRRKHQAVAWGSNLLLLGGFDGEAAFDLNDVWSYDGHAWQMVTDHAGWSGRDGHCAVVVKGSIYVLGGTDDPYNCKCDVWRSDNGGSTWLQICPYAPWPERWQHAACVYDGRIYVIGGWGDRYLNDVWASADGINWTQECAHAPWKPRMFLSAVVINDAIYVIGGHDGRMQLRDVWASSDGGKSWTQVCQAAQWEGRQGHACVALDGHVYLMGGFGGATRFNDLWRSSDCAHWTLLARNCNWSPRQGHACLAYRGSIYILGGFDASGYSNDVYKLRISSGSHDADDACGGGGGGRDGGDSPLEAPGDAVMEPKAKAMSRRAASVRQITVSITCVMDSINVLRTKRYDRERLVQGLVSVVGLVMKAVNITAESLEEVNSASEGGVDMCSSSEDVTEGIQALTFATAPPRAAGSMPPTPEKTGNKGGKAGKGAAPPPPPPPP